MLDIIQLYFLFSFGVVWANFRNLHTVLWIWTVMVWYFGFPELPYLILALFDK
jgi:hypothetical protein